MPIADRNPTFLVIGSMKCGTTSLHHYLSLHPDIRMSWPKELNFFVGGDCRVSNDPPWGNWWRGLDWYRRHFATERRACGEVSPAYVGAPWGRLVVERIHQVLPAVRLVMLVREPLERLGSDFLMRHRTAKIPPMSFADYVADVRSETVVAYSCYGTQIARFLERFPRDALLVVESAELDRDRGNALARIFSFIGVDPSFRSTAFAQRLFESRRSRYPSRAGVRILRSALVRAAERVLPFTAHEALKNVLLCPFSAPPPDLVLPPSLDRALRERFRDEVALARTLTGLPLPSLGE
jgi:hypothetical protein